jgi:Protein of unknown function (DUF2384)
MNSIDIYRNEYPGDEAWKKFVEATCLEKRVSCDFEHLSSITVDETVSAVLWKSMGEHAVAWLKNPCGALGKRPPAEIIKNEHLGINVIKTLLMRMPI